MRVDYITDIVEIPEPNPPGLPESFGKSVCVIMRENGRRKERYGYIIGEANEVVEVAYYVSNLVGYQTGFFNEREMSPSPYSDRPATYAELQKKGIELDLGEDHVEPTS